MKKHFLPAVPKKCRVPKCKRPVFCRGLCSPDYQVARRAVIAGETTWEAMEAAGKVDGRKANKNAARNWFKEDK